MNLLKDRTMQMPDKIPGLTPFYALLGITDLTVETLRDLGAKDDAEGEAKKGATGDVMCVVKGAAAVPALALSQTRTVFDRGQVEYADLAKRGEKLIEGLRPTAERMIKDGEAVVEEELARTEKVAKRLLHQAEETVARGRSLATSAATDAQKRAETTLRSMRAEAEHVVDAVTHPGRVASPKAVDGVSSAAKGVLRRRRMTGSDTAVASAKAKDRPTATAGGSVEAASTADTTRKAAARKAPARKAAPRKTAARKRTTVPSAAVAPPATPEVKDAPAETPEQD